MSLIWIFIVLINQKREFLKKLLQVSIISWIFVWIIWLKEYYLPTFDYSILWHRAVSTFWHPNYLSLFILILIPLLIKQIKNKIYLIIFILLIFLLFLTKSIWWIFIFLIYILYVIYNKYNWKISKIYLNILILLWVIILSIIIYKFSIYTKLNSFFSRFYIWETTLNIIFFWYKKYFFMILIMNSWICFLMLLKNQNYIFLRIYDLQQIDHIIYY